MASNKKIQLLELLRFFLYISPFVFPLYLIKFQIAGIPFTFLETFIYFIFAVWLIDLIRDHKKVVWSPRIRNYCLLAFVLLIGATIGVLVAPHNILLPSGQNLDAQKLALGVWKGWIFAPMLYFVVLIQVIKEKTEVDGIMRSFVYSAGLISLIAYGLAITGSGLTYDFRLSGFYESANYLALYLVPAILINTYFVLHRDEKNRQQNLLDISVLALMVHALFFSQSYAAILALFGSLILYALYFGLKYIKSLKKVVVSVLALALVLVAITVTQLESSKFKQFVDFESRSSTTVRLEIYQIAGGLIKKYPITGHGLGLFQARYQTQGPNILGRAPMEWNIPHPHNIFLAFYLNVGLIGFLAFLLIILLAHLPFTYPLIAIWGTLLHGVFDTPFWKNDLAMVWWLLIGSIVILQNASNTSKIKKSAVRAKSKRGPKKIAQKRKSKTA